MLDNGDTFLNVIDVILIKYDNLASKFTMQHKITDSLYI